MTRLIDADKLRAEYQAILDRGDMFCEYDIIGMVDNAPTVDERPHGEWIEHQDCYDDTYYTCSHCGEDWITIEGKPTDNLMNYCPMCGADMRGDNND